MEETDSASFTILVVSSGVVQQKEQRQIAQVLYEKLYPVNGVNGRCG